VYAPQQFEQRGLIEQVERDQVDAVADRVETGRSFLALGSHQASDAVTFPDKEFGQVAAVLARDASHKRGLSVHGGPPGGSTASLP